jgi:hypothetical protein
MNSDYTHLSNYYKNQNNYIPTRYYCEAFASADVAYFDVFQTSDGTTIKIDASQISTNNNITALNQSTFSFDADKINRDIKSFDTFTWNPNLNQYETSVTAISNTTGPIRVGRGSTNVYNKIYLGKTGASLSTFFGSIRESQAKGKQQAKTDTTLLPIARVYVTY